MIDIYKLNIDSVHESLSNKEYTVRDLVSAYLNEIENKNKEINAFLEVFPDVLDQADIAQKKFDEGTATQMTGIPIALKDNMLVFGKKSSSASKILENFVAPYDATVVKKLKEAGAVIIGRTNMDEFAMGSSTENSAFGVTKNPNDLTRVSGGSSGGSTAAVAMHGTLVSLGSDTGGSVRQPASFCGCVGLKPTYGSVSRNGLMAMASSLDIIGPISHSVTDAEIVFNTISGIDPLDSTTIDEKIYPKKKIIKKPVIGIPKGLLETEGLDNSVKENFLTSIEKLKSLGYETKEVDLPNMHYSLAVYYILMPAEVSSNLARFDGIKYGFHKDGKDLLDDYLLSRGEGFGQEVRRRIILGTYVLSSGYYDAYYNKALLVKDLIASDFKKIFNEVDAIITPTTPTVAFKIGEKTKDPLSMYLADIFTVPANIVGIPAISIPSGIVKTEDSELPLGIQFISNFCREDVLFMIGKDFLGEK